MNAQICLRILLVVALIPAENYVNCHLNIDKDVFNPWHLKILLSEAHLTAKQAQNPCFLCSMALNTLITSAKLNEPFQSVKAKLMQVCQQIKVVANNVCSGIIDKFGPVLMEVLRMTTLRSNQICTMFVEGICSARIREWSVQLPSTEKPSIENKYKPLQLENVLQLKVLQLNDFHMDKYYSENSDSNCMDPLCCRTSSNRNDLSVFVPAGRWGDYRCDLPLCTIEKTLEHIVIQHPDVDYILWTGDLISHDIWQHTQSEIIEVIRENVKHMKQAFPNTKIIPNIGNHELLPPGTFAPPWVSIEGYKMSWLLNELYSLWEDWIPVSEKNNFLQNGYFSVNINSGLKVISLNTNYGFHLNWWLYVDSTDPGAQLQWLIQQLQESENVNQKVHIVGHVDPGSIECLKTWSANYYKIINRYEATVTGQFFAHSHFDEFKVFYDENDYERPVSVSYMGPSLSTYTGLNPAYRIYYVDGNNGYQSTWEVTDHETWMLDLDKANSELQETPEWVHCYSAKKEYNLTSLRPQEWNRLISVLATNNTEFQKYFRHSHRNSPVAFPITPEVKELTLCNMKSAKSHSRTTFCGKTRV